MKKFLLIPALVAAIGLSLPMQAQAGGGKGAYAVAGFLGGVLLSGLAYHDHHAVSYHTEVVEPVPAGHYVYTKRKVWIPGCWEYVEDDCATRSPPCPPGGFQPKPPVSAPTIT